MHPRISALAEATGLDRSTLGRNLRVLQKDGWASLSAGTDERTRLVTLTKAGQLALLRAVPLWDAAQAQVRATYPPALLQALASASAHVNG